MIVDFTSLTRFIELVMRIPSERRETISDLVSILVDPDQVRRREFRLGFYKFLKKDPCRLLITRKEKAIYDESEECKLGRMAVAARELPSGIIRALSELSRWINPEYEDNNEWSQELRRFLDGGECWTIERSKPLVYLKTHFVLRSAKYSLVVYELIRRGNFRQIFGSLRDGRLDKVSFPSLRTVTLQCNQFSDRLGRIRDNQVVFFLVDDEDGSGRHVAYADFSWPEQFEIITRSLKDTDQFIWLPTEVRQKSHKRIFVVPEL